MIAPHGPKAEYGFHYTTYCRKSADEVGRNCMRRIKGSIVAIKWDDSANRTEIEIGRFRCTAARLSEAIEEGNAFSVIDGHDQEFYDATSPLFDHHTWEFTEAIQRLFPEAYSSDVFIFDGIELLPACRGLGIAQTVIADLFCDHVAGQELGILTPGPLNAAELDDGIIEMARKRLTQHWKKLGFRKIPRTQLMGLSGALVATKDFKTAVNRWEFELDASVDLQASAATHKWILSKASNVHEEP